MQLPWESDMLDLMVRARDLGYPADCLVRCQHNRVLPGKGGKLWAAVAQGELLGQVSFEMPRGRGRRARTVTQEIRAKRISLSDGQGGTVEVTCVFAREMAAPAGSQPVMWRLLTNRTVDQGCSTLQIPRGNPSIGWINVPRRTRV